MHEPEAHGSRATNRDWIEHEQVHKQQSYRLAEQPGAEQFDDEFRIATCDLRQWSAGLAADRAAFALQLGTALQQIGFAILDGHGVPQPLVERAERQVQRLFCDHDLPSKLRYRAARHGSVNQGYFPIEQTSGMHRDLVEGWVFCRRAFRFGHAAAAPYQPGQFWPDPAHEPVFGALVQALQPLILPVMQSVLCHLGQDPHAFDQRLGGTNIGLRLNYYPPLSAAMAASGQGRLLGHEDVDLFTLVPAPEQEGLQVLHRQSMKWIRLHAPRGTIILNTGDYLQRISNDVLPSTTHRVSQPSDPLARAQPRVSMPLNVYLFEHELLEVLPGLGAPRYGPVQAERFHTAITRKHYGADYAADVGPDQGPGS